MFGSHVKIRIDKALFDRVRDASQRAGYASEQEFVEHVLEKALADRQQQQDDETAREQLRGLGYLE